MKFVFTKRLRFPDNLEYWRLYEKYRDYLKITRVPAVEIAFLPGGDMIETEDPENDEYILELDTKSIKGTAECVMCLSDLKDYEIEIREILHHTGTKNILALSDIFIVRPNPLRVAYQSPWFNGPYVTIDEHGNALTNEWVGDHVFNEVRELFKGNIDNDKRRRNL